MESTRERERERERESCVSECEVFVPPFWKAKNCTKIERTRIRRSRTLWTKKDLEILKTPVLCAVSDQHIIRYSLLYIRVVGERIEIIIWD